MPQENSNAQEITNETTPAGLLPLAVVATKEAVVESPEFVADGVLREIGTHVDIIANEAQELHRAAVLSLGGGDEGVVAQAEQDVNLHQSLKAIGERVRDIVSNAKNKIATILNQVDGSVAQGVNAMTAAALIGVAANIPNAEVPEIPLSPDAISSAAVEVTNTESTPHAFIVDKKSQPIIQNVQTSKVVSPEASQAESTSEEEPSVLALRASWYEKHDGKTAIDTLDKYLLYVFRDKDSKTSVEPVELAVAEKAVTSLHALLTRYPKELHKHVLKDAEFLRAMDTLNTIGTITGEQVGNLENPEQFALAKMMTESIQITHRVMDEMHGDFLAQAIAQMESGNKNKMAYVANFFEAHVANATLLMDERDGPALLESVSRVADATFTTLSAKLKADTRDENGVNSGVERMFPFLVQAGHKEAIQILVEKLASGEIDPDKVPHLFDDNERNFGPEVVALYTNPKYEDIGKGGEVIATSLLQKYGLLPAEFIPLWKNAEYQQTRNESMRQNSIKFAEVERNLPGGAKMLTTEEFGKIRHPGRYPLPLLLEQLGPKKENTPFGATVTAVDDYNGAFAYGISELYGQAKANGFQLRVAEAENQREASQRLLDMVAQNGKRMSFIGVRGHGAKDVVRMGKGDGGNIDATFLGVGPDRSSLILEEGAPVYFESCSTGKEDGIAQKISSVVSGEVIAPDNDTSIEKLTLTKMPDGRVTFQIKYNDYMNNPVQAKTYFQGRDVGKNSAIPKYIDSTTADPIAKY